MKNLSGLKLIMIAALALMLLAGTGAAVSLSNSGGGTWKYQREISIKENSGTELTDYQVPIELKGADFPSEAKSDGADVRFTDSSGNELSYWIESWDYAGKSAKVWVKAPTILTGSTTNIRMYYGNPSASAVSNGDRTFEFFDDFLGVGLDFAKWSYSGTPTASNSILVLDASNKNIASKILFYQNVALRMRANFKLADASDWVGFVKGTTQPFAVFELQSSGNPSACGGTNIFNTRNCVNGNCIPLDICTTISGATDAFNIFDLTWLPTENKYFVNGVLKATHTTQVPSINLPVTAYIHQANTIQIDWILVRKYTSSEPTITFAPPKSSSLSITKTASPYSLRQFQESTIKVLIENSGTSEVKAIEIMDSIHPSFDLTGGDFPNPKKFDSIRAGESRELQYTIKSKESGAFTLDPATVTYADSEGNIQEVKSEPVSIKVVPSSDGGSSGTNTGQNSKSTSVSLHGEKTDVVMGEDILLKLSAVNLITKPKMHVQVIIIPPSGMSVTSSEFSKSAAGQFTANYQLEPGDGKDIEVRIRSNQIGDFNVNGRIIYYFGNDKEKAEDQTLNLPIKVRKEIASTQEPVGKSTPGFEGVFGISGLLFVLVLIKRGAH